MASLYDSKGESKQVELWLEKGERPNYPFVTQVRLEHARWLIRQAKPILARETVLKGSPEKNQKVEFDFLLAIADQMEGKHEEAERTLTRLHQENSSNPLISNHLAWSLVESSDEGKRGRALQIVTSNAKKFVGHGCFVSLGPIPFGGCQSGNEHDRYRIKAERFIEPRFRLFLWRNL